MDYNEVHKLYGTYIVQFYSDGMVEKHRLRLLSRIVLPKREERRNLSFCGEGRDNREGGVDEGGMMMSAEGT